MSFLVSLFSEKAYVTETSVGDKANHVATIHLPQLLYLFAFTAFFSLPLLTAPILTFLSSSATLLHLPCFPRLKRQYLLVTMYTTLALVIILGIIKYNTIIHPFTLADNRHYVFYVFRYTILRHSLIRYLLAPVYMASAWAVYLTLCASPKATPATLKNSGTAAPKKAITPAAHRSEATREGPKTSFLIIFIATTALSLITAPLVEPRYFIIPWVIWRLHVPSLPVTSFSQTDPARQLTKGLLDEVKYWAWEGHDYRLWLETVYFMGINVVTGYVFLYRGFEWPQEAGKVQRFMW